MGEVAVIIKHPFRDDDWRVDVYAVPDDTTDRQLYNYVMRQMMGPFQIVAVSWKVDSRMLSAAELGPQKEAP